MSTLQKEIESSGDWFVVANLSDGHYIVSAEPGAISIGGVWRTPVKALLASFDGDIAEQVSRNARPVAFSEFSEFLILEHVEGLRCSK